MTERLISLDKVDKEGEAFIVINNEPDVVENRSNQNVDVDNKEIVPHVDGQDDIEPKHETIGEKSNTGEEPKTGDTVENMNLDRDSDVNEQLGNNVKENETSSDSIVKEKNDLQNPENEDNAEHELPPEQRNGEQNTDNEPYDTREMNEEQEKIPSKKPYDATNKGDQNEGGENSQVKDRDENISGQPRPTSREGSVTYRVDKQNEETGVS